MKEKFQSTGGWLSYLCATKKISNGKSTFNLSEGVRSRLKKKKRDIKTAILLIIITIGVTKSILKSSKGRKDNFESWSSRQREGMPQIVTHVVMVVCVCVKCHDFSLHFPQLP